MTMRVIVTGASGFIGYHLAERLLADGFQVLGIDNMNTYYEPRLKQARLVRLQAHHAFRFELIDVGDTAAVMAAFARFSPRVVVHLAAQAGVRHSIDHPHAYVSSNVAGFLNVLEACRQYPVDHLIYASSSSVYGENGKVPFSEHDGADHPVSLYAATKRSNELMAHSYAHLFGIPATALRFFTVYGPWGRPDMAYYRFTKAILAGEPIDVFNHGQMERDFTYIDDVIGAIAALISHPPDANPTFDVQAPDPATSRSRHRIYNIGNHRPVALSRFIKAIETACGRSAIQRSLPMQPGDVPRTFAAIDDLAAAIGFSPKTGIETGIARFVEWYREFHRGAL
jgi:UDP-glucuronate 4-epimerase